MNLILLFEKSISWLFNKQKMGANCSCLSNHISLFRTKIAEHSSRNIIIDTKMSIYTKKLIILIQACVRGFLFRKNRWKQKGPLIMKMPTETSHIIREKTKITNEQMKTLFPYKRWYPSQLRPTRISEQSGI